MSHRRTKIRRALARPAPRLARCRRGGQIDHVWVVELLRLLVCRRVPVSDRVDHQLDQRHIRIERRDILRRAGIPAERWAMPPQHVMHQECRLVRPDIELDVILFAFSLRLISSKARYPRVVMPTHEARAALPSTGQGRDRRESLRLFCLAGRVESPAICTSPVRHTRLRGVGSHPCSFWCNRRHR